VHRDIRRDSIIFDHEKVTWRYTMIGLDKSIVKLQSYNPMWQEAYEREAEALTSLLESYIVEAQPLKVLLLSPS
jgi:GrpB-like predicted nucleotidyltransferase (UPF0157 family)